MYHSSLFSTVDAGMALGPLFWDALAGIVIVLATVKVARASRALFSYGIFSKTSWIVAVWWLNWHWGLAVLPLGGLAAIWHVRRLDRRSEGADAGDLPFAAGRPAEKRGAK